MQGGIEISADISMTEQEIWSTPWSSWGQLMGSSVTIAKVVPLRDVAGAGKPAQRIYPKSIESTYASGRRCNWHL